MIERHVQTILVSLVTMAVGYLVSDQISSGKVAAATNTQMEFLTRQVVELRADIKSLQVTYVRAEQFNDHEVRLRQLENSRNKEK